VLGGFPLKVLRELRMGDGPRGPTALAALARASDLRLLGVRITGRRQFLSDLPGGLLVLTPVGWTKGTSKRRRRHIARLLGGMKKDSIGDG